jgi:L-threonylcarbamoyladenylate synthase
MPLPEAGYFSRAAIEKIAAILAAGGVAVLPTDTIYGFHCAASCAAAVQRIRKLKGKDGESGFILLAADSAMVDELVAGWPGSSKKLLSSLWPAPLTAVLPARKELSPIFAPHGRVAVRVPAHRELRSLIALLGEPIVSTSVNISGRKPMTRIAEIRRAFPGLDAYISRKGGPALLSSTVVDFTVHPPRLVRAGRHPFRGIPRAPRSGAGI